MKRAISIAVASALSCITANGMEFRKEADQGHPGQFSIYASGQIVTGDSNTFERLATGGPHDIVFFNSPGGSLGEGLAIGAVIRERGITTAVSAPNSCYSACALAWLGGRLRLLADGADVGSHAAFIDDNGIKTEKGSGNAVVGAYLSMLGLHIDAIAYLTSASPDNVVHITRLTARKYGIAVSFFDNNGEVEEIGYTAVSPTQPSSAPVAAPAAPPPATPRSGCSGRIGYVTGLDPHGDNNLSVRDGPHTPKGLGHEIDELFTGDSVCIDLSDRTWLHVQYIRSGPAKTGWVHSHYIRLSAPPSSAPVAAPAASPPATPRSGCSGRIGYVTGLDPHGDNNLSVRDGPHTPKGLGHEIDELFTGDLVCIASFDGTWLHVQYIRSGLAKTGWVHSHYIRFVESPSTAHQQSP